MDISDEYIKMVLALPDEFFEGWECNNGDQVFLLEEIKVTDYACSEKHGLYTVFEWSLATEEHICTEHWMGVDWLLEDRRARPIPRQEQLQELSGLDWWTFYSEIIHGMVEYEDDEPILCVCLRNVMRIKYKMIWNGEEWDTK